MTVKLLALLVIFTGQLGLASSALASEVSDDSLLGHFEYKGGFGKLSLPIAKKEIIKSFRLAIPKFCADVEVLEAGTVTEGVYDEAKLVNKAQLLYSVNNGAGTRLSSIEILLNGPKNTDCAIPVFLGSNVVPPPSHGEGNLAVNLCNRARTKGWIALGYFNQGEKEATGWWPIERGQCLTLRVRGDILSGLYLHGKNNLGGTWGTGEADFCVQPKSFTAKSIECEAAEGYFAPFSKLRQQSGGVYLLNLI